MTIKGLVSVLLSCFVQYWLGKATLLYWQAGELFNVVVGVAFSLFWMIVVCKVWADAVE